MRLTLQTDHALRILMALAAARGEVVSVDALARTFGVSKNHLMKTAQALTAGGFVATVRGRKGGLLLARDADTITVASVIAHVEPDLHVAECFFKPGCSFLPRCRLKGLLTRARSSFMQTLESETLADLVGA